MAGGAQQPNQSDNSSALLWVIAAVFIFGAILWYVFKPQIIHFYFQIKIYEIDFLSLFTSSLEDVRLLVNTADLKTLSFQDVVVVGDAVGNILRWPFILIIFLFALAVFFSNSIRQYKRTYSMRELVSLEKVNWPQIMPVAHLNLVKSDIDKGPWAMALTPMQFCKRYNLLEEHKRQPQEGLSFRELNKLEVSLKRGSANKIFAMQLGPLWPGINRLPPHVKALFAAFAARIEGHSEECASFLRTVNVSSGTKMDFLGADALCAKYAGGKIVQKIVRAHGYMLTVMATMLEVTRLDGVQASADFLWLKPLDRRLWYMMNTVGRQTPFTEVAGPFSHWKAEKEIGRRLLVPMVEEATNALEISLKEIVYTPDEKE